MTLLDSLVISASALGTVFAVLIALSAVISLQSKLFALLNNKNKDDKSENTITSNTADHTTTPSVTAAGQLKLINVDEKTAAMIMAIVSDESQIPLSELSFMSIKAID